MRALVISDTHIKSQDDIEKLRAIIEPFINEVDVIIHAGDSVAHILVDFLRKLKPLYIARGNMDFIDLAITLPEKTTFEFGGFKIGLTHGWGSGQGLKERVFGAFKGENINAIIFGHSHRPYLGRVDGVLMLNPGSPTDTRFADRNSVAILEANGDLKAQIIEV